MNAPTDFRALFFATAPYGRFSILAPLVLMVSRLARRALGAVRRPHISAVTRSALVRDGFSIDPNPFIWKDQP